MISWKSRSQCLQIFNNSGLPSPALGKVGDMASIITVASQKGGAGKTTICRVVAPTLARLPAELAETHDVVLVDTAGFGSRAMVVAIGAADAVVIPCQPDRGSVREAQQTGEWCANLSASVRREIPFRVAIVAFDPRRATDAFARAQLEVELRLPVLRA